MSTAIKVENIGKKYILSHQNPERYIALRDVITDRAKSFGKKILDPLRYRPSRPIKEEFWALKDVSFEIKQGDRVGIIGRNGAGKTTLLKLLSRITEPTTGRIVLKGRVASLLEVGTGFHPELTGRENIFLNGAILGMSKSEIKKKFDEIVDFAEVEKFLDTPVKRYSSGMYVRLAFAVAAHLEPEILIVDEVLAVGDAQFQKKCLGKMQEVGKEGRTVLFVSHNMASISTLCSRGLVLSEGHLSFDGDTPTAISHYLICGTASVYINRKNYTAGKPLISKACFESRTGDETNQYYSGDPICLMIEIENSKDVPLELSLAFYDNLRRPLWNFTHSMHGLQPLPPERKVRVHIIFYPPPLTVPELLVDLATGPKGGSPYYDHVVSAIKCSIVEKNSEIIFPRFPEWPMFCDAKMSYEVIHG